MHERSKTIWVGTSGFSYSDWVGPFYPPGMRWDGMLPYYARYFHIVELNFSFYRMPSPGAFEHMVQRTRAGFQFVVKMHSDVTHAGRLDRLREFTDALDPLRTAHRLTGVLCQFPQSFHCTMLGRSYLRQLKRRLHEIPVFVEFRHRTWSQPRILREVEAMGLGVVSVDVPAIPSLFPRRLIRTGPSIYVRFHSRRPSLWYADGKDRYDYLYSEAELEEWVGGIQELLADTEHVYLLFNNCRKAQAARNAEQVQRILENMHWPAAGVSWPMAGGMLFPPHREADATRSPL